MPRYKFKEIYKSELMRPNTKQIITTSENTFKVEGLEAEQIYLLDRLDLQYLRIKNYDSIHLGAVQITAKPLVRIGLDFPVLICLYDARIINFQQSLLAVIETNLAYGPIYFNCFPNIVLDCQTDNNIHEALTLSVQTKGPVVKDG